MLYRRLLLTFFMTCGASCCGAGAWAQEPSLPPVVQPPIVAGQAEPAVTAELREATEGDAAEVEEEEEDELETDRDSFTPATSIASRGTTIVEAAYTFVDNRAVKETHSYPELLIRYGLSDLVELRLGWNKEIGGAGNPVSGNVPSDFEGEGDELEEEARLLYGAKFFLSQQQSWVPQSSFIVQGFTPTSGKTNQTDLSATYVFGWRNERDWQLNFAARYGTGRLAEDEFNTWEPSAVWKIPVGARSNVHAEYFGVFTQGRAVETTQHFFSSGAHYLLTHNLELGARVGWGLNEQSPNFFSNVGVGWRF